MRSSIVIIHLFFTMSALLTGCARSSLAVSRAPSQTHPPALAAFADPQSTSSQEIGDTRNSRVAIPMPGGEKIHLVFLAGEMSQSELNDLKAVAPNVRIIAGLNRQTALEHASEAQGIDIRVLSPELLAKADKLVWVQ